MSNKNSKSQGLGDTIKKVAAATGVEKLVKSFFGDDCGCEERRKRLNQMFPYSKITPMTPEQITLFKNVLQPAYRIGTLSKDQADEFYRLYEEVFNVRKDRTNCATCNKSMYLELLKVFKSNCDV